MKYPPFLLAPAGNLAVAALKALSRLPPQRVIALGAPLLPLYVRLRRKPLRIGLPDSVRPDALAYYRMRLRLAALSLRHLTGGDGDLDLRIEGLEHYRGALAGGRPVALLGWHQGPVELLHRLPLPPEDGRPFIIATAGGFAPRLTRFLADGRRQAGKITAGPGQLAVATRSWARKRGVLAFMVDQVPGIPEEYLELFAGRLGIPCPAPLVRWCLSRKAELLTVQVRLLTPHSALFRFRPLSANLGWEALREEIRNRMEEALAAAPDQFNWSYPKLRLDRNARPT